MEPSELPLRDLHLPEAVGWWPLAPGWWLLLVLIAAGILWLSLRAWRQRQFNAARRYAMHEFGSIESQYLEHRDPLRLAKQLSSLLRRGMLAYAPRGEIAGLTGERWLEWLDRDLPVPYFHTEGGKSLTELPYRNPTSDLSEVDINALLAAVKIRLSTPVGGSV